MSYHRFSPPDLLLESGRFVYAGKFTIFNEEEIANAPTPLLVIDCEQIRQNARAIQQALPDTSIYYALKCNPDVEIVRTLANMGIGFEIASLQEAQLLQQLQVPASQIICFHTIKSPAFLQFLHAHHIDIMAVDSYEELYKIAQYAPHSRVVARVEVPNNGSIVDLSGKFGIAPEEAPRLLAQAQALGLRAHGITMHVGSQCVELAAWEKALQICLAAWKEAHSMGLDLQLFSLGGGLPVPYRTPVITVSEIGSVITRHHLKRLYGGQTHVTIEPGRAIAATAGTIVTTVIGVAQRANELWAYLDVGIFNGLMEALLNNDYEFYSILASGEERPLRRYNLGGPTCDSVDTPFRNVELPELRVGDRLYILHTGAYSASCASSFNGFSPPEVVYLNKPRQADIPPAPFPNHHHRAPAALADSLTMHRHYPSMD